MAAARRVYLYVMAFAGLMVSLYAVAGMLAVLVAQPVLQSSALLGASDLRSRTSLYLAELVVGLPIWLGHWLVAERFARRSPEERDAPERRLFLAAVFGVTAVVALFALRGLLRAALTLPGAPTAQPSALPARAAGAGSCGSPTSTSCWWSRCRRRWAPPPSGSTRRCAGSSATGPRGATGTSCRTSCRCCWRAASPGRTTGRSCGGRRPWPRR